MNIINTLTVRHLKQNKRRTLVTIIGVIISVAMVTAVATLGVSFMGLFQKQEIANGGEWHVLYKNVNKAQLEAIHKDDATKTLVISRDVGYSLLEGSQNENKPYLFIREYNTEGFQQFPIELSKGRLPQAANEVVISDAIASNAKVAYKLGDTLSLEVGERIPLDPEDIYQVYQQAHSLQSKDGEVSEILTNLTVKSYTIVGFIERPTWEPTWAPGYTVLSYVDEELIDDEDTVQATVVLNKVNKSLYTHAEQLAAANNIDSKSISYNNGLLRYYGVTNNDGLNRVLISLSAIIMAIIMVGSISLIYNAFAISVSERARHLGMLSSVGATNKQKKNSVFFEGAVIGLISIPIGIIAGLVGIGITFWFINSTIQGVLGVEQSLTVTVTPFSIIVACVVSMVTILISTYSPARKASKISAIDAIRQTTDIKLTSKALKTSKLVRSIFGIEAEIGLKNLKRNKRRYQATVFSLVISIVLFLSVAYFTDNLKKSVELSQSGINYDMQVYRSIEIMDERLINSITSLEDVTEFSHITELGLNAWFDQDDIADELQESVKHNKDMLENGKFRYYINLLSLDETSLKAYTKKIGADYEQMIDPKHMAAIVIDTITYEDAVNSKYVETKAAYKKIGDRINLLDVNGETEVNVGEVEIATLTDQLPMSNNATGLGGLTIVVSEQVINQLDKKANVSLNSSLYLRSGDPMRTQQDIEEMNVSNLYVYNMYQSRQQEERLIMLMSVFMYGFIILITAISVANIFNTTSTSISLRKREFAMLKSVGMTPKGFNQMINYESIFYGIKSLLYGLPISILAMYLIHRSLMNSFSYRFSLPWASLLYVTISVFIIVGSAMLYASSKVKQENIIDALKQESI